MKKIRVFALPALGKYNKYFDLLYNDFSDSTEDKSVKIELERFKFFLPFCLGLIKHWYKNDKNIIHLHRSSGIYGSKYVLKTFLIMLTLSFLIFVLKIVSNTKVIWTVHNKYSHDYPHPLVDKWARKVIYFLSDAIIVEQKDSINKIRKKGRNKKLVHISHPSYKGVYGPTLFNKKEELKKKYGFAPDDIVLTSIGMIRPYKKTKKIIKAFSNSETGDRTKLLIIGQGDDSYIKQCKDLAKEQKDIILKDKFVEEKKMSELLGLTDFSVFYYDDSAQSSGSLILSLSYGVPVITRDIPTSEVVIEDKTGFVYSSDQQLEDILANIKKKKDNIIKPAEIINSISDLDKDKVRSKLKDFYLEI